MKNKQQTAVEVAPVEVNDLRKCFGEQKVLDGINLRVARGETVAVGWTTVVQRSGGKAVRAMISGLRR